MKLSEAVRAGEALVPPGKGALFTYRGFQHDICHNDAPDGADAFGAALWARAGEWPKLLAVLRREHSVGFNVLCKTWPGVMGPAPQSLRCSCSTMTRGTISIYTILSHRQDHHAMQRGEVAAALEGLGL